MLNELTKIALLGTDRADFSEKLKAQIEQQGIDTDVSATQLLLEAAALGTYQKKAGFLIAKYSKELPDTVDDADEYVCSENSAYHLQQILEGKYHYALAEFIEHLTANNKQLPPELLPDIISKRMEAGDNYETIRPIIGKRGAWLLEQNPAWCRLVPVTDVELWAEGSREERIAVLKYMRSMFPDLALEMLLQSWKKERKEDKIAFLEVLSYKVSLTDEAFLEKALDDKNKEIQAIAATLLAQIVDSDYVQRLVERIFKHLHFENAKLDVNLPIESDEAGQRDGLFSSENIKNQGLRAAWFGQMLSLLPPHFLQVEFNCSPLEILKAVLLTDYTMLLLGAFLSSTLQNKNEDWAADLLRLYLQHSKEISIGKEDLVALNQIISKENFNEIVKENIEGFSLYEQHTPLPLIVIESPHFLNIENSIKVVEGYKQLFKRDYIKNINYISQKENLKRLAYKCDVNAIEELMKGWDINSKIWDAWVDDVETFVRIMKFRKAMVEGLNV